MWENGPRWPGRDCLSLTTACPVESRLSPSRSVRKWLLACLYCPGRALSLETWITPGLSSGVSEGATHREGQEDGLSPRVPQRDTCRPRELLDS